MVTSASATPPDRQTRIALEALNFFMADMQAGLGPFLGVFLQQRGWATGAIGLVMTLGGVAGVLVTAPAGALVDATRRKRLYVIISGLFTVLASSLIWISQAFWVIASSQIATAIAGAAIGPAVAGITLGIARQRGFNRQNGRNQAFNHAGNTLGAALSGFLGWKFGFVAIFWLAAASVIQGWGVYPVQVLDGVGAGLQSVAVPGLVARILNGTGRVNVGQGAVMTVQGVGAALSPAIGGGVAQLVGYRIAFLILGSFALASLLLWLAFRATTQAACDGTPAVDAETAARERLERRE